jgi:hypothetical protein
VYAPFASTKSSALDPIAFRAALTRWESWVASRPTFILTREIPSATHPPSWRRSSSTE